MPRFLLTVALSATEANNGFYTSVSAIGEADGVVFAWNIHKGLEWICWETNHLECFQFSSWSWSLTWKDTCEQKTCFRRLKELFCKVKHFWEDLESCESLLPPPGYFCLDVKLVNQETHFSSNPEEMFLVSNLSYSLVGRIRVCVSSL